MKIITTPPLALLFLITGCASIMSESIYPVIIKSFPEGASFTIIKQNGEKIHQGTTPASISLKSSRGYFSPASYVVKLQKQGFAEQTIYIKAELDGWYIGNLFFGDLLGFLIIDPITGAMWKLPTTPYYATLEQNNTSSLPANTLTIVSMDSLSSTDIAKLIPLKQDSIN